MSFLDQSLGEIEENRNAIDYWTLDWRLPYVLLLC